MKRIDWKIRVLIRVILVSCNILISHLFLQWCQNQLSVDLALKFAFSWHAEKFFLGSLVLLFLYLFLVSLSGSFLAGTIFYDIGIGILGFATYLKMAYRQEPIYPDDLKMITQFGMLREIVGNGLFFLILLLVVVASSFFLWFLFRSFRLSKKKQILRVSTLLISSVCLLYVSHFNDATNLLRKGYNKTALWIPYSQQMNYYNTGFVGGFLYNLRVDAMEKPSDYSKKRIDEVVANYSTTSDQKNEEKPNIVFVMSESFSDPDHLEGVNISGEPLADYYEMAQQTYSGKMLSQNYGGGTANIEFEALTSFSMELFNPQMTTPYTMLVPKMKQIPSLVSLSKSRGYQTTAIHPYDTSMYKRKDVYDVLGFDQFLDQDSMAYTDKLEKNPYISDASAYQQVLDLLKENEKPQFIHLVTMQTHMPYGGKYDTLNYPVQANGDVYSIESYLQDVSYASQALKTFLEALNKESERTIVVFWGDHLPGIYSDVVQEANEGPTLHETQFLMWDSKEKMAYEADQITSPFYFAPKLFEKSTLELTPFYQLLVSLEKQLPAFEKQMYKMADGSWKSELALDEQAQQLYEDYRLIQYDVLQGDQFSLETNFFQ